MMTYLGFAVLVCAILVLSGANARYRQLIAVKKRLIIANWDETEGGIVVPANRRQRAFWS